MDLRRQSAWLAISALIAAASLAAVHAMETFGHYLPCELCLKQRDVDWIALAVAVLALLFGRLRRTAIPIGVVAVGVAFAVGFLVAGYHAGVEWRWWPGPQTCTGHAAAPVSAADVGAVLSGALKLHMVRCDEAALRIAGLSLAGWNALLCLALSLVSFAMLSRRRRL